MHLSLIFLCVLCALCGLIIPIQPELILFVKPESLLLKAGGDTPQENLLRMLTRKSDRSFNQYR
jgi:hypothetical protein